MSFTAEQLKGLQAELREFLEAKGYQVDRVGGRYDETSATIKLELSTLDDNGEDGPHKGYRNRASMGSVPTDALDQVLTFGGTSELIAKVTGYYVGTRKARKIRVIEGSTGKEYLISVQSLAGAWARYQAKKT